MVLVESFSGIRGIFEKDLTGDIARRYAYVFHNFLKQKLKKEPLIVIGMDTRESSDIIKEAIFDALFDVIDVNIMTTPGIEFAVRELKTDGGIIITASHNEPEYNGIKFLGKDGAVLGKEDAAKLIENYHKIAKLSEEDFLNKYLYKEDKPKIKKIKNIDIKKGYFDFLLGILKKENVELIKKASLKVVLDPVGGPASIANELLKQLNVETVCINCNNGDFKRVIEPNGETLSYLKDVIKKHKADFAAGFDLDGDRMAIMTKDGEISGNYILALLVDDVLEDLSDPKNTIVVTNDATSQVVKKIVEKHNAQLKEVEVGEINVVSSMYNVKSPIGGEGSCAGGIYPPSKCRDGILSLLFILKIIAKKGKNLKEIVDELPVYYNFRRAIEFDKDKHDEIKLALKKEYKKYKIHETGGMSGGLKVSIDDNSYIWFRASKTEGSKFRIISDSNDKEKAEKNLLDAVKVFKKIALTS